MACPLGKPNFYEAGPFLPPLHFPSAVSSLEFVLQLGPDDRLRETHMRERGQVLDFAVQYETRRLGKWAPVVRYGTAHGFAHRDLYRVRGETVKTPLVSLSYNQALTFAESDLGANWQLYRERFLREERYLRRKKY